MKRGCSIKWQPIETAPIWEDWRAALHLLVLGLDDDAPDLDEKTKRAFEVQYPEFKAMLEEAQYAQRSAAPEGDAP